MHHTDERKRALDEVLEAFKKVLLIGAVEYTRTGMTEAIERAIEDIS
jgi:hypothetical protein